MDENNIPPHHNAVEDPFACIPDDIVRSFVDTTGSEGSANRQGNNVGGQFDDSDDEDKHNQTLNRGLLLDTTFLVVAKPGRAQSLFPPKRMVWDDFVGKYESSNELTRALRMSLASFNKLTDLLRQDIKRDELKGSSRGGCVSPEVCVFVTLRYLAGASYLDLMFLAGISRATLYAILNRVYAAILQCPALDIHFPQTIQECMDVSSGFRNECSFQDIISNCIGALDGYLAPIITPAKNHAGNVKSFFSGRDKQSGINIQAVCDHHCRFTFFALAEPGSVHDRVALKETNLPALLRNIPVGYVLIADDGYNRDDHIVPVYSGEQRLHADHDNFNHFASQCRIRAEMAFGLLTAKWGILGRPIGVKLTQLKFVLLTIARLHNFTINEHLLAGVPKRGRGDSSGTDTPDRPVI